MQKNEALKIEQQTVNFYEGFNKVLQVLIKTAQTTKKLGLVVHGVPNVGKSSLASALAVHFASTDERATLRTVTSKTSLDSKCSTKSLHMLAACRKWVLVDEVDMRMFDYNELVKTLKSHRNDFGTPVIFFTSGHFPPNLDVISENKFEILVIDIQVDYDYIQCVWPNVAEEKVKQILDVTKNHAHAFTLLDELENRDMSREQMINFLYGADTLRFGHLATVYAILIAYTNRDGFLKYISVDALSALAFAQRSPGLVHQRDEGVNAILNMTNIVKVKDDKITELTDKYTVLDPKEYFYCIRYPTSVNKFLEEYENEQRCFGNSKLKILLDAYKTIGIKKGSTFSGRTATGCLYETLLDLSCREASNIGLIPSDQQNIMEFATVDKLCGLAANVEGVLKEVLDKVEEKKMDESSWREYKMWFTLNVERKAPFKGYDFMYVMLKKSNNSTVLLEKCVLMQAALNPALHKTKIMADILQEIRSQLVQKRLIPKSKQKEIVKPIFITPTITRDKQIELDDGEVVMVYYWLPQPRPPQFK